MHAQMHHAPARETGIAHQLPPFSAMWLRGCAITLVDDPMGKLVSDQLAKKLRRSEGKAPKLDLAASNQAPRCTGTQVEIENDLDTLEQTHCLPSTCQPSGNAVRASQQLSLSGL